MNNKIFKVAIIQIIKSRMEQRITSQEAYKEIAKLLNLSAAQLNEVYNYENGQSFNKFETKVRAAVEELRSESVLVRGGKRGLWVLT